MAAGAVSVTLLDAADQPILEPAVATTPLWDQAIIKALFAGDHAASAEHTLTKNIEEIKAALQSAIEQFPELADTQFRFEPIEDQNWERKSLEQFHAFDVGPRLRIVPSWRQADCLADKVNLLLDPGLAFGTGSHPTTRLCLEYLQEAEIEKGSVIDFGCGSGILGIAALTLGAEKVIFIDNDPQAITATTNNLALNGLSEKNTILINNSDHGSEPGLTKNDHRANILVANILAGTIITLYESIASRLNPGGVVVLSGLLTDQVPAVIEAFSKGFDAFEAREKDGWSCVKAKRI